MTKTTCAPYMRAVESAHRTALTTHEHSISQCLAMNVVLSMATVRVQEAISPVSRAFHALSALLRDPSIALCAFDPAIGQR